MITNAGGLIGKSIAARDGTIGKVKDVLFDDVAWGVRYLVIDTGSWLATRKVLVSPESLGGLAGGVVPERLPAELTREEIEGSPGLAEDAPVSLQFEQEYASYYRHSRYWEGLIGDPIAYGFTGSPPSPVVGEEMKRAENEHGNQIRKISQNHLRSVDEVNGYRIVAQDGEIGEVDDALVGLDHWRICYFVLDTRIWLPGKKVVVPVDLVKGFDWQAQRASIGMTREEIKDAPAYDADDLVGGDFESKLSRRFGNAPTV